MTKTDNSPVNASELLRTLMVVGANYTNTRHMVVAHMILNDVKPSLIVTEGKVDASEVSRIKRVLSESAKNSQLIKSVRALDLRVVRDAMADPLSPVLAQIAKTGEAFKRTTKKSASGEGKGAPKLPVSDSGTVRVAEVKDGKTTGKGADRDITEVIFEWVTADFATRGPILLKLHADAESYLADLARETALADIAADAA